MTCRGNGFGHGAWPLSTHRRVFIIIIALLMPSNANLCSLNHKRQRSRWETTGTVCVHMRSAVCLPVDYGFFRWKRSVENLHLAYWSHRTHTHSILRCLGVRSPISATHRFRRKKAERIKKKTATQSTHTHTQNVREWTVKQRNPDVEQRNSIPHFWTILMVGVGRDWGSRSKNRTHTILMALNRR